MKKCNKCEIEKIESEFHKESRKKDGLCNHCKECEHIRCRLRREKDPEHYRKLKRENARKHADKRNEKLKKNYHERRETVLKTSREYYQKNREIIRKRQNELNKTPEIKKKNAERQSKWQKENREKSRTAALKYSKSHREQVNKWHHEWKKKNLIKSRAQQQVKDHIRRGTMIRGTKCEICRKEESKMHAHHDDYNKPLDVRWLCKICHNHEHGKLLDIKL